MAKILIVDDAADLAYFLLTLLEKKGYDVKTVPSFHKLKKELGSFTPDIILLDVMLYGENGRNICKIIRANIQYIQTPIILLSASPEWLRDYKECGADDFLEKPFNIDTLVLKIEKLLVSEET